MRRLIAIAVVVLLSAAAAQMPDAREAVRLGRTQDEALFAAFSKGYALAAAEPVASAEIITEFRRAVLIVREHMQQGEFGFTERDLQQAITPYRGLVSFIVQVNLHPLNNYQKVPAYEMYISTGSGTPPLSAASIKRDPIYAIGGPGSALIGVRLEMTLPAEKITAASAPELIVTNERADVVWRARVDLSRFR